MGWYVLKLLILLPLIGGMVWGSLKLSQVMQNRMQGAMGAAVRSRWSRR
jgi:flagellar protein FliO/FliZ